MTGEEEEEGIADRCADKGSQTEQYRGQIGQTVMLINEETIGTGPQSSSAVLHFPSHFCTTRDSHCGLAAKLSRTGKMSGNVHWRKFMSKLKTLEKWRRQEDLQRVVNESVNPSSVFECLASCVNHAQHHRILWSGTRKPQWPHNPEGMRSNGEHASKGPCRPGFSQSFYSVLISRDLLQGQDVLKAFLLDTTKSSAVQSAADVGTEVRFERATHRSLNKICHFFLCTSEEEAKSEGNKRPCFPPLGLGECREADKLSSSESENDQKQSESCGRRGNKLLNYVPVLLKRTGDVTINCVKAKTAVTTLAT
ncbi:hypothetical protein PAMA_021507 [Pampus argenteus]